MPLIIYIYKFDYASAIQRIDRRERVSQLASVQPKSMYGTYLSTTYRLFVQTDICPRRFTPFYNPYG